MTKIIKFATALKNLFLSLGQRLVFGVLVLTFIVVLSFVGLDMARGVPLETAATEGIRKSIVYFSNFLVGELGQTTAGGYSLLPTPVIELVPEIILRSLGLLAVSLVFSATLGIILGLWGSGVGLDGHC